MLAGIGAGDIVGRMRIVTALLLLFASVAVTCAQYAVAVRKPDASRSRSPEMYLVGIEVQNHP